jgi:hypothetical protein
MRKSKEEKIKRNKLEKEKREMLRNHFLGINSIGKDDKAVTVRFDPTEEKIRGLEREIEITKIKKAHEDFKVRASWEGAKFMDEMVKSQALDREIWGIMGAINQIKKLLPLIERIDEKRLRELLEVNNG